jgi:transmembrane sensor
MSRRANRDAARWAARRLDPPAADDAGFEAWRAADPSNADAFERVWRTAQDPALVQALSLGARQRTRPTRNRARAILVGGMGLATCAFGAVLAWPQLQLLTIRPAALETAAGQQRTMVLNDGTQVTLDGATRLEVRLGSHRRQVRLVRGEAFFDVAHDAGRPFVVSAPEGSATVLGTAFDLERGGGRMELSVHRGRVRLAPPGLVPRTVELTVGQSAFASQGRLSPTRRFDPAAEDWRTGWLETEGVSLDRLVERLNRVSAAPIVIADPALADRRVAGRFRLDEPEALVRNLALVHGFVVRRDGRTIVLDR